MAIKVKIKARGEEAQSLIGMKNQFRNPDKLNRLNGDESSGKEMMDENPESRQAEDTAASENSDITKKVKPTTTVPTAEAAPVNGYDCVKPVDRALPQDMPERARRVNNQVRDMRTNLGRGKPGTIVQE
jgi:hypothetical protein